MIKVGNIYYFGTLIFAVLLIIGTYFFLKKKSKKFAYNYLLVWCFMGFALHFIKQLVYWDVHALRKSTAENICAVSTMVFPFIMLRKKDGVIHDFMYFIGVVGGLAGTVYPTEAIGEMLFSFDTLRFYFCHISLLAIPLIMAMLNIYRPKLKSFYLIPLCFLVYEFIICVNTALLITTGLYKSSELTPLQAFLDRNSINNSFVFGPTDDMGKVGQFIGSLCPNFMKLDIFNINGGEMTYWPVIWLLIPSYVLFVPIYLLVGAPFFIIDGKEYKLGKKNKGEKKCTNF